MRIVSPVDNLAETALLLEAGADELYGGFLPPEWTRQFGALASLNQRTFAAAQIESETELVEIVAQAHGRGKLFALTLNAPFYSDAQLPLLVDYVDRMVELGIDSLILADLGLLRLLVVRHPSLVYHASTLAHLANAGALAFFARQGISRAVLPRHLTIAEMSAMAAAVPDVECDAFLMVGKCPNREGLCTFHHSNPERIWPCEIPYQIDPLTETVSPVLRNAMSRQASWAQTDRRHGCGLCAIPQLLRSPLSGLKLVGRGAPTAHKARNISLAREFIELAKESEDFPSYQKKALAAHRQRFGTECHVNVCYYPELYPGEW